MPESLSRLASAVSGPSVPTGRNRQAWVGFMAFFVVSAGAMTGLVATAPEPSGKVALVYAPYVTTDEALRRAVSTGALPIRQGNVDWIVVVAPPPDDQNFSAKAHISGALAILNPVIAGGCSPDSSSAKDTTYRRSQ